MTRSESIAELAAALAAAQGAIRNAPRTSAAIIPNQPKREYADLASVWDACRSSLSANGLAVIQAVQQDETGSYLESVLAHRSGEWVSCRLPLPTPSAAPNAMQALGSAITYARGYSLMALVGIAPGDDDDGEAAAGQTVQPARQKPQALPAHPAGDGNGRAAANRRLAAVCKAAGIAPSNRPLIHYIAAQLLRLGVPEVASVGALSLDQVDALCTAIEQSTADGIADLVARHAQYRASEQAEPPDLDPEPEPPADALLDVPARPIASNPGHGH